MGTKLAVVLSALALVVALLGSTSAGQAALNAVIPVPLAKHAYLADTARNAVKVDNIKASRIATPGMLVPLDATGKLPSSVGAVGPKGDKGDQGPKGDAGATQVVVRASQLLAGSAIANLIAHCAPGEVAVGGGGGTVNPGAGGVTVFDSKPVPDTDGATPTGWSVGLNIVAGVTGAAYVICAKP